MSGTFGVTTTGHSGSVETRQEQQARHPSVDPGNGLNAELTSVGFAALARSLSVTGHRFGITKLSFRSPGGSGVGRGIRRHPDGSATIAVGYRGRPALAVAGDMIEGIVHAMPKSVAAASTRDALWQAALSSLIAPSSGREDRWRHSARSAGQRSPGAGSRRRSQSSAARRRSADPGSGPPEKATRRAA